MRETKTIKAAILAATLLASPVQANEFADQVIQWLEEQGFSYFQVERTWLGRIKIEAYGDGIEREIILSPRTGEILRDYWEYDAGYKPSEMGNPLAVPPGMGNTAGVQPLVSKEKDDDQNADIQQVITATSGDVVDDAPSDDGNHGSDMSSDKDDSSVPGPVVSENHKDANGSPDGRDDDKSDDESDDDKQDNDDKDDGKQDDDKKHHKDDDN